MQPHYLIYIRDRKTTRTKKKLDKHWHLPRIVFCCQCELYIRRKSGNDVYSGYYPSVSVTQLFRAYCIFSLHSGRITSWFVQSQATNSITQSIPFCLPIQHFYSIETDFVCEEVRYSLIIRMF